MDIINNIMNNIPDWLKGYSERDGFRFVSINEPSKVFDAILVKPKGETSFTPRYPMFDQTIEEYVEYINKHNLTKALIITSSLEFLKKCPTLQYLEIIPSDSAPDRFDYSPLYSCANLKYVKCRTVYGVAMKKHTTVDYSKVSSPLKVVISETGHFNCDKLTNLKTLSVSEHKSEDLKSLIGSKDLTLLNITASSVKKLDGIEKSKNLKYLVLYHNLQLNDIGALSSAKDTLRYLEIESCGKVKNFSVLEELSELEELHLRGSNTLPSLSFIKKLQKLKIFSFDMTIEDGDLSPCLNLNLAYCAKGKKHYNLKDSDLPKGDETPDYGIRDFDDWLKL